MPTERPTTPDESTSKASPEEHWSALEGRIGGTATEDEQSAPPRVESEGEKEKGRKPLLSRRARVGVGAGLTALAAALASIAVMAATGDYGGRSRPRSGEVHAKRRETRKRGSGQTRRVEEAGGSPQSRQGRTGSRQPHARRRARPRRKARHPARRQVEAPARPPESVAAPPEQPPEPSAPAPAVPSAPDERPGLRDGATESAEFGL